jgi:hypothetical protein
MNGASSSLAVAGMAYPASIPKINANLYARKLGISASPTQGDYARQIFIPVYGGLLGFIQMNT